MTMFPASEQRKLGQIQDGLRADDSRFARRVAVREGVLRWAAPGRQDFVLLLALAGIMVLVLLGCAQGLTRWFAAAARAMLPLAGRTG